MAKTNSILNELPRVPPVCDQLQTNTCRNPKCENFGRWPSQNVKRGSRKSSDVYRIIGGWGGARMLWCKSCGQSLTLKSNQAIVEEFNRLWSPHVPPSGPTCRNGNCVNNSRPLTTYPDEYQAFGNTTAGSKRYRCKQCGSTFSVGRRATLRQRFPKKNELILRALINKAPMRRICEIADIRPAVLYNRLKFFRRQCDAFGLAMERPLVEGRELPVLHLAVDRQDYVVNWGSQFSRQNTQLGAIATADNKSSYVFGMHLDYDPSVDAYEADLHAREIGDYKLPAAYRHYARIWLPEDIGCEKGAEDVERPQRLPANGVQVRREYTMFGHFLFLKRLLAGATDLRFYLDPESNINAACLTAFNKGVSDRSVEAYYVSLNKNLSIDQKRLALAEREALLTTLRRKYEGMSDWALARKVMAAEYESISAREPKVLKRWVTHPLPHMGEPQKRVCYITDRHDRSPSEVAELMLSASLHGVDRYFMQLRRRISLLERPIATASSSKRM